MADEELDQTEVAQEEKKDTTAMFRTYTFIVGKPVYVTAGKATKITDDIGNPENGDAYLIKELQVNFNIKKDNSKDPNKGYITIFNLSDNIVNYLDANQNEKIAAMFYAGYNYDEKLLFSGTIEFMEDKWNGETRETKFILGDASDALGNSRSSRSYKKGTPLNDVLNGLVSDLNLPTGRIIPFGAGETLQYSMAFSGNTAQNLTTLAGNTGSTFSVQDGAVYWTREGSRLKDSVFEISEETGMINSPTPKNPEPAKKRKAKRKPNSKAKKNVREDAGLTVTSLLNGAIIPETTIYLKSKSKTGFYKVVYLEHKGSLEGGDWQTELGLSETRGELVE